MSLKIAVDAKLIFKTLKKRSYKKTDIYRYSQQLKNAVLPGKYSGKESKQ